MSTLFGWATALTIWRLAAARLIAYPTETASPDLSMATAAVRGRDRHSFDWLRFTTHDLIYHDIYPVPEWLHARKDISDQTMGDIVTRAQDALAIGYEVPRPYDVLIQNPGKRGGCPRGAKEANGSAEKVRLFRPHVRALGQTDNCFYHLRGEAYLSSPEYLFMQMASLIKDPVQVAVLECELTGCYALLPLGLVSLKRQKRGSDVGSLSSVGFAELFHADGYVDRIPLTTVKRLGQFVDAAPAYSRGAACARMALSLVKDGSRSPMETVSSIQLRLSRRRGGFGAGDVLFNQRVDIKPEWQEILRKDYLLVDELFYSFSRARQPRLTKGGRRAHIRQPRMVGAEYQGGYHATDWQMTADNQRRLALEDESLIIYFITGRDFLDERAWNIIGERIARDVGHDYGELSESLREKRAKVHAMLADPNLLKY